MNTIDHRRFTKPAPKRRALLKKRTLIILGIVLGLFTIANVTVALLHKDRALPRSYIGTTNVSGKNYTDIQALIERSMLPNEVVVTYKDRKQTLPVSSLGIHIDRDKTMNEVRAKPLLPLWAYAYKKNYSGGP